jgi:hypothetical protein
MGKRKPRREARFANWRDACYKFLLEDEGEYNTNELTQRVLTADGRVWKNSPSVREICQVLKYDSRFEYVGNTQSKSVLGGKYMSATFRARRSKDGL